MNPTTAGSQNAVASDSIFLQKFSLEAFLEIHNEIDFNLSEYKTNPETGKREKRPEPLPYLTLSNGKAIWIATKLKPISNSVEKLTKFRVEVEENIGKYSIGLLPANVDKGFSDIAWVLYRNGEGASVSVGKLTREDILFSKKVGEMKRREELAKMSAQ
jgi:hypothetical protein